MKDLLKAKADACYPFRKALRDTKSDFIIHSTYPSDIFWASGLHHDDFESHNPFLLPGKNKLGKLLMDLRKNLKDESEYTTSVEIQEHDSYVLCLYDGEVPPISSYRAPKKTDMPEMNRRYHPSRSIGQCSVCGVNGHDGGRCWYKSRGMRCHRCGQLGHKKRFCRLSSAYNQCDRVLMRPYPGF